MLATTRHRACVCVPCVSNVISGLAWNTVHELVSTPKHPALACRLRGTSASRKLRNARIEQLADSLATRLIHFHPVVEGLFGVFFRRLFDILQCISHLGVKPMHLRLTAHTPS